MQDIKFRLGRSDFFLGAEYILFDSMSTFKSRTDLQIIDPRDLDSTNAGLGFITYYDSRDNILSPVKGQEADLTISRYDTAFGGDRDCWR
jgi:hypothetical protein